VRPESLDQALDFLAENGPSSAVIAGGTDLSIAVRSGELNKAYVVDVSRLPELREIQFTDGVLSVGAGLTFSEIMKHPLAARHAPLLVRAVSFVGGPQIRNMGTIGGNVANASPAADSVPALTVHRARAYVQRAGGIRVEPIEDLVIGPYRTTLKPDEIVVGFLLEPMPQGFRCNFNRLARRSALAVARVNAAAWGRLNSNGLAENVRVSMGAIMPRPTRLECAEELVNGRIPTLKAIQEAAQAAAREMTRVSGVRPSTEYKKPAVEGLLIRTLAEMFDLVPT
jgi:CO/xanthine dehydrogenase FAD-binding subunit